MPSELECCPKCGALPCDWVDNPHKPAPPATQAGDMEPLGEAFERVWDANTDKLYEFATQADDALVEELARIIWSVQYPTGTSWDDWAKHHATNNSAFDGRNWAREHARAILPIFHRERAAAHAAGRAAERALAAVWQQARENHANYSATGDVETDIRFFALGLAGEAGEVANFVKKRWRDGDGHDADLRAEVADVFAYNIMLADALGMTPESLIAEVARKQQVFIEKMKARDAIERGQHKEDDQ